MPTSWRTTTISWTTTMLTARTVVLETPDRSGAVAGPVIGPATGGRGHNQWGGMNNGEDCTV
jgi:hypothetical protein